MYGVCTPYMILRRKTCPSLSLMAYCNINVWCPNSPNNLIPATMVQFRTIRDRPAYQLLVKLNYFMLS